MYKIYINDTPLCIAHSDAVRDLESTEKAPLFRYMGSTKLLSGYLDMLEKTDRFDRLYVVGDDPKAIFRKFSERFDIVEAAGGIIRNEEDEVLIIFRLGRYDLPKGKLEKGELPREAALREVMEETGVGQVKVGDLQTIMYHSFRTKKGRRILKRTYWFGMKAPKQPLTPQSEENIEEAIWVNSEQLPRLQNKMYHSIADILQK